MNQLRILIIDDEKLIRWSTEKYLTSRGYRVLLAETGEEGITLFEANHPEVVLVDNKLPGYAGNRGNIEAEINR